MFSNHPEYTRHDGVIILTFRWELPPNIFLDYFPFYLLRQGLLVEPIAYQSARLARQFALGIGYPALTCSSAETGDRYHTNPVFMYLVL